MELPSIINLHVISETCSGIGMQIGRKKIASYFSTLIFLGMVFCYNLRGMDKSQ